jgi:hypothetical protein
MKNDSLPAPIAVTRTAEAFAELEQIHQRTEALKESLRWPMITTTKATHTPGPWKLTHSGYANAPFVLHVGDVAPNYNRRYPLQSVDWIAEIRDDESPDHPRYEANALLIAAAPDLADLVLRMFTHVSHGAPTRAEAEVVLKKAGLL